MQTITDLCQFNYSTQILSDTYKAHQAETITTERKELDIIDKEIYINL